MQWVKRIGVAIGLVAVLTPAGLFWASFLSPEVRAQGVSFLTQTFRIGAATEYNLTFPAADAAGALQSDGAGTLSFSDISTLTTLTIGTDFILSESGGVGTLSDTTNIQLDLDEDNNTADANFLIRDGADANVFSFSELGNLAWNITNAAQVTNNGFRLHLDNDNDGSETYQILDGADTIRFQVDEDGETHTAVTGGTFQHGGVIDGSVDLVQAGNVGTGEDEVYSDQMDANTLNTNSQGIIIRGFGQTAANANAKTIKVYLGGTGGTNLMNFSSGINARDWGFTCWVYRVSAASQKSICQFLQGTTTTGAPHLEFVEPVENEATNLDIVVTAEATTDDDIILEMAWWEVLP